MEILKVLKNRYSSPLLQAPAPTAADIALAWEAMMRVPDHARLKPLQLQLWQGEGLQRLGNIFARCALQDTPDLSTEMIDRYRALPLRAPMVAIVIAGIQEHPKVPEIEQVISTGCAAYAMILALNDLGYGCMWRTGAFAYQPRVKEALGVASSDHIVGFIYTGTRSAATVKKASPPEFNERVVFIDR